MVMYSVRIIIKNNNNKLQQKNNITNNSSIAHITANLLTYFGIIPYLKQCWPHLKHNIYMFHWRRIGAPREYKRSFVVFSLSIWLSRPWHDCLLCKPLSYTHSFYSVVRLLSALIDNIPHIRPLSTVGRTLLFRNFCYHNNTSSYFSLGNRAPPSS
jgi:hypothetical protein